MLAVLYTIGFLGMCFLVATTDVPEASRSTIDHLMGIMSAVQLAIVNYFYGSSKTSADAAKAVANSKERTDVALTDIAKKTVGIEPLATPVVAAPIKATDVTVNASGDVNVEQPKEIKP